jgi:hypothetical protein
VSRRQCPVLAIGIAMSIVACSSMPPKTQTGAVQEVAIGKSTLHLDVTVHEDDEIRWINERDGTVQIIFLDSLEGKLNCKRGFGLVDVANATTLKPRESVSLCFSEPASLRYTVRLDRAMPTGWLNATGRVVVERNTDFR